MRDIDDLNAQSTEALNRLSAIAGEVDRDVGGAVTALQFQDMVGQLLQHVRRRLENLDECGATLARIGDAAGELRRGPDGAADYQGLHRSLDEAVERLRSIRPNPVQQQTLATGDVELF